MTSIFITYLEQEGPFIKVWGQTDRNLPVGIEKALQQMTPQFEKGQSMVAGDYFQIGILCCAKYKDGLYYRARIVSTAFIAQGMIEVMFIDFGNKDFVPMMNIRNMSNFSASLISIPPQARDFILAGLTHATPAWDPSIFELISNELRYLEFHLQVVEQAGSFTLINLIVNNQDVGSSLVSQGYAILANIQMQQIMLQQNSHNKIVIAPEMIAQNMVMKPQYPPALKSPTMIQQQPTLLTYKSLPLEAGSEHAVYVSYVTDGPCLFSVQLQKMEDKLKHLMMEINSIHLEPLDESPLPGCVCLARSTEDDYICRAVVTNMVDGNFKVFYVDFGNTEELPFSKLFQIPFRFVIPKVMATRFALAGLNSVVSLDMKCAFKDFVNNKILYMRVKPSAAGTALALCDLWDDSKTLALDHVHGIALQSYPDPMPLTRGINQDIKVSFVYGCKRFYIQLKTKEDELNILMAALQEYCLSAGKLEQIQVGLPCNALYDGDGMFYRAQILDVQDGNIKVRYVDYGNEELVLHSNIRAPQVDMITSLRPQAIECCLNGYQNMDEDTERDNLFEELILEQDFSMKVAEIQSGKILVELIDSQLYNVASLLLEKIAAKRSQVSPALVQENSTIGHRKRTPPEYTKRSPREHNDRGFGNKQDSWRDNRRQPSEDSERAERTDWRESKYNKTDNQYEERNFNKRPEYNQNRMNRNENSGFEESTKKQYDNKSDFNRRPRNEDYTSPPKFDSNRNQRSDGNDRGRTESDNYGSKSYKDRSDRGDRSNKSHQKQDYNRDTRLEKKHVETEPLEFAADNAVFMYSDLTGTQEQVTISWFYNPNNFYCQLKSSATEFRAMMTNIQTSYKHRESYNAEVGCPVIAGFNDGAKYRATVLEKQFGSYKLFFVDFGNTSHSSEVYQMETKYMSMAAQAHLCSIDGIKPCNDKWPIASKMSFYFEKSFFDCNFLRINDLIYYVDLSSNGEHIKDQLIVGKIAEEDVQPDLYSDFDITLLLGQQIRCQLASVNNLSDILLQLQPGLFVNCKMHNLEAATETFEQNLQHFLGAFVIVYIDKVLDNCLEVTLYDDYGLKLQIVEPDEGAFDNVISLCPMPVISPSLKGYVSHATETSVFIQPTTVTSTVAELLESMFNHCDALGETPIEPELDLIYAVKSSDGNWYRGKVMDIQDTITVQYVDYGNSENVGVTSLRELDSTFYEPHMLSMEILMQNSLAMLDQEVSVYLSYGDDGWVGALIDTNQIEQAVVEEIIAPEINLNEHAPVACNEIIESESTDVNEAETVIKHQIGYSVELSHFDNPGQFYLQLEDALDSINELQDRIQAEVLEFPDIENITTGVLCAAQYSGDQLWYRAQVLDGDSEITTVRFVDYGNTDVLNNDFSKIKTLPSELLSLEHHAKRCSLYLQSITSEWSAEACEKFEEAILNKHLTAEIVHQDEKTTFVDLYADGENVGDVLKNDNFTTELKLETSSSCTGFVSHINSPSEFWIQLESACNDLEWVADQLTNAATYAELEDLAPGSLCAAVFPDDGNWYRARILSNTVAGLEVLFVDYGNSCTCSLLRELPEDLVMLPPLAQKCSLSKPTGLLQWPTNATNIFKEIAADGITIFSVIKLTQGETSIVQLMQEGNDVSLQLKPETVKAIVKKFNGFDDLTVQTIGETSELQCTLEVLPGYSWSEDSRQQFMDIYNNGETEFEVEMVTENLVHLYINGNDVRSNLDTTKCTPVSSAHSSPHKSLDTKTKARSYSPIKSDIASAVTASEINTEDDEVLTISTQDNVNTNQQIPENYESSETSGAAANVSADDTLGITKLPSLQPENVVNKLPATIHAAIIDDVNTISINESASIIDDIIESITDTGDSISSCVINSPVCIITENSGVDVAASVSDTIKTELEETCNAVESLGINTLADSIDAELKEIAKYSGSEKSEIPENIDSNEFDSACDKISTKLEEAIKAVDGSNITDLENITPKIHDDLEQKSNGSLHVTDFENNCVESAETKSDRVLLTGQSEDEHVKDVIGEIADPKELIDSSPDNNKLSNETVDIEIEPSSESGSDKGDVNQLTKSEVSLEDIQVPGSEPEEDVKVEHIIPPLTDADQLTGSANGHSEVSENKVAMNGGDAKEAGIAYNPKVKTSPHDDASKMLDDIITDAVNISTKQSC